MIKINNIIKSVKAIGHKNFYRKSLIVFIFAILLIFFLLVILTNLNTTICYNANNKTKDEYINEYKIKKEENQIKLDMYLGKITPDFVMNSDEKVIEYSINELKNKNALYTFYINTDTCEKDYIYVNNIFQMNTTINNIGSLKALFFTKYALYFMIFISILISCNLFPKKEAKLFILSAISKKDAFFGKILYQFINLFILFCFIFIIGVIFNINSDISKIIMVTGTKIKTIPVVAYIFIQIILNFIFIYFVISLGILLSFLIKNKLGAFFINLVLIGTTIALGIVFEKENIIDNCNYLPMFGLLFNKISYYDFSLAYNIPLCIVLGLMFQMISYKKYTKMEF